MCITFHNHLQLQQLLDYLNPWTAPVSSIFKSSHLHFYFLIPFFTTLPISISSWIPSRVELKNWKFWRIDGIQIRATQAPLPCFLQTTAPPPLCIISYFSWCSNLSNLTYNNFKHHLIFVYSLNLTLSLSLSLAL